MPNFIFKLRNGFSGKSHSYVAIKENGKYVLVKDGIEGKEYNYIYPTFIYSINGNNLAYIAEKENGKEVVVKDGIESKEYENIQDIQFLNINNIAFIIEKEDGKRIIVENGKESIEYKNIFFPHYNIINNNLGYFIEKENGGYVYILDGKEKKEYKNIQLFGYLHYGKVLIYKGEKENGKFVIIKDGEESEEYDSIDSEYFSSGDSFTFVAEKDKKYVIVADFKESNYYSSIGFLQYSLNGNSFSFLTKNENEKYIIVRNGKEVKEYNNLINFIYSDDGFLIYSEKNKNGRYVNIKETCFLLKNKNIDNNIKKLTLKSKKLFFKDLVLSKKALENSLKGEMFKLAVDKRVYGLSDEKLVQFHDIVGGMNLNLYKYKKYKLVLEYMKAKIGMELWSRERIEKEEK